MAVCTTAARGGGPPGSKMRRISAPIPRTKEANALAMSEAK